MPFGDFCCVRFGGFAKDFPGGFFWALFPTEMRRKNPATNPRKNPAAQNKKSAENPFCQNPAFFTFKVCFKSRDSIC